MRGTITILSTTRLASRVLETVAMTTLESFEAHLCRKSLKPDWKLDDDAVGTEIVLFLASNNFEIGTWMFPFWPDQGLDDYVVCIEVSPKQNTLTKCVFSMHLHKLGTINYFGPDEKAFVNLMPFCQGQTQ